MHMFYLICDVDQDKKRCLPVYGFSFVANLREGEVRRSIWAGRQLRMERRIPPYCDPKSLYWPWYLIFQITFLKCENIMHKLCSTEP